MTHGNLNRIPPLKAFLFLEGEAGSSYTDDPPEKMKTMSWTNWPLFTVGMVQMSYSDENIQKILGGNSMRVMGAALT